VGLWVTDSIVDSPSGASNRIAVAQDSAGVDPGPPATFERVTVFGEVRVRTLVLASDVIFTQPVLAKRRQIGCMRYTFVDDSLSVTPRRFRCQPDLALSTRKDELAVATLDSFESAAIRSRVRPQFTSTRYGDPGYAQLRADTAVEIRAGAASRAEMGVFESLWQPQREANLRELLKEYMPYGLEAGFLFVT
jgi:hypothetical protein